MAFHTLPTPVIGIGCECSPNNTELVSPILNCICSSRYWTTDSAFEPLFSAKTWLWVSSEVCLLSLLAGILYLFYNGLCDLYRASCYIFRALYNLYKRLYQEVHEGSHPISPGALELRRMEEQLFSHQTTLGQLNAEDQALYQRIHQRLRLLAAEDSVRDTATDLKDTQQDYLDAHETALRKVRADQLNFIDRDALRTSRLALSHARQTHHKALEARRDIRGVADWTIPTAPAPLRIRTYMGVDVKMTRKGYESVSKGHEDAVRRACAIAANKHKITKVLIRSAIHNTSGDVYDPSHITCNFYDPDNEDLYRAVHVYVRYANLETGELCSVLDASTDYIPEDYAWERVMYERDSFLHPKYEQWMQAYGVEVWADGKAWSAVQTNDWHIELDRLEDVTKVDCDPVRREAPPDENQPEWQDEGADWQENSNCDEQENIQDGWLGTLQEGEKEDTQTDYKLDDQTDSLTDVSEDDSDQTEVTTEKSDNISDQTDLTTDVSENGSDQNAAPSEDIRPAKVNEEMRAFMKVPYHLLPGQLNLWTPQKTIIIQN